MRDTRIFPSAAALLLAACGSGEPRPGPPEPAEDGAPPVAAPATDLRATALLAGREQAAPPGHNAVACVALAMAARAVTALPGSLSLERTLSPEDAAAVRAEPDLDSVVPRGGAAFVHAAPWTSASDAAITDGFRQAFGPDRPPPRLLPGAPPPGDWLVGYAALLRDLRFAHPFVRAESPLRFRAAGAAANAKECEEFGLYPRAGAETPDAMLAQVRVLFNQYGVGDGGAEEYGVALVPEGVKDRVVLAVVKDLSTPGAAWRRAKELAGATGIAGTDAPAETRLRVPVVDFDLEDARDPHGDAGRAEPGAALVRQRVRLRLDRRGVELRAEALVPALKADRGPGPRARPPHFFFDRPFVMALVRDGESEPYLLVTFANDDLFASRAATR